jgi:hypothetical protein
MFLDRIRRLLDLGEKPDIEVEERRAFVLGRRNFLFLGAAAAGATIVAPTFGEVLMINRGLGSIVDDGTTLTTIHGMSHTTFANILALTYDRDSYIAPHEKRLAKFYDSIDRLTPPSRPLCFAEMN